MAQKPGSSGNRFDYEKAYADAGELKKKRSAESSARERDTGKTPSSAARLAAYKKKKAKRARRNRILLLAALCLIVIAVVVILLVTCRKEPEPEPEPEGIAKLELQSSKVQIDELYVYGTHLNAHGLLPAELTEATDIFRTDLVLYNGDFIEIPIIIQDDGFILSEYTNGGLYLDDIPRGEYTLFVRGSTYTAPEPETEEAETETETVTQETARPRAGSTEETTVRRIPRKKPDEPTEPETSEDGEPVTNEDGETVAPREVYYRYFAVSNASDYPETVYYTMSSFNNRIVIGNEYEYPTMQFTVSENTDQGVYDVVIDPGHGGYDAGAVGIDDFCERDFTLPLSLKIKALLEQQGMKVALTRDSDKDLLKPYGPDGRIARAASKHAKYMISVHMNSSGAGGLEIYSANGIDYSFSDILNDNIQKMTGIGDTKIMGTAHGNVFSRNFSQADVEETINENVAEGLKPYEPTTRSSYYFIIRETGGIATGAYMDDRNPDEEYNPYCNTNVGVETYITELGYITVREDLEIMQKNMDGYAKAIADSLMTRYGSGHAASGGSGETGTEGGSEGAPEGASQEETGTDTGEENESTTE